MIKSKNFISVIFLLSILVACVNNTPTSIPTIDAYQISTIIAATLTAIPSATSLPIPSATVSPMPTVTSIIDVWTWHNIDLYTLELKLPYGWIISEVNRRPEPIDFGGPITGHDCADYDISNPDGSMRIFLLPTCGFAEGVGDYCPKDTVIVSKQSDKSVIVRYYNQDKSAYIYTRAGLATISDNQGTRSEMLCSNPPIISFGKGQNLRFIHIEFQYLGTDLNIDQILTTIDKIILSIGEQ
jgi:hypothetical protein